MWVAACYANDLRKICLFNIYDNLYEEAGLPLFLQENEPKKKIERKQFIHKKQRVLIRRHASVRNRQYHRVVWAFVIIFDKTLTC